MAAQLEKGAAGNKFWFLPLTCMAFPLVELIYPVVAADWFADIKSIMSRLPSLTKDPAGLQEPASYWHQIGIAETPNLVGSVLSLLGVIQLLLFSCKPMYLVL